MRTLASKPTKAASARAVVAPASVAASPRPLPAAFRHRQHTHGNGYVQRFPAAPHTPEEPQPLAAPMQARIQRALGGGRILEDGVRATLEPAFGTDFSAVRVHTDAEADALSRHLQARAFTLGQDIFFRQGDYNPASVSGRQLLAHELTHVVQQTGAVRTSLQVGAPDDVYEQEAERVAQHVMSADMAQPATPAPTAALAPEQPQRQMLRRAPTPGAQTPQAAQPAAEKPAFDLNAWLGSGLHDLLKEHLEDDKLKSYSKSLAEKAAGYATEQMKGLSPESGVLGKVQLEQMGKLLAADLQRDVTEILSSPAAQGLRDAILRKVKMEPGLAIGMALIALAMATAAVVNIPALQEALGKVDIPEVKKDVSLGAGFTASGKANLGKLGAVSFRHVELGLSYTSQYFKIAVTGAYSRSDNPAEQKAPDKAAATADAPPVTLKADAIIDENQRFKINIAPALNWRQFGVTGLASFDTSKGWTGFGELRIGEKTHFVAPKISVGPDGQLAFDLTHGLTVGPVTLGNTFTGSAEQSRLGHSIALSNPFGLKNLDVKANLNYRLDQPQITGAGLSAGYTVFRGEPDKARPEKPQPYLMINIQGGYTPAGTAQPAIPVHGAVALTGAF